MATGVETKDKAPEKATTASDVLRHPIRVRILGLLNKRDLSPVQFHNLGLVNNLPALRNKPQEAVLSHISYHFRVLAKAGCIEVVETIPRRGSVEHIYRARARAQFDENQWADLEIPEREAISKLMLQSFIAQAEGSMLSGTFDLRPDRWLVWASSNLDKQGWKAMISSLETCWGELEEIRQSSTKRLEESGEEPIPMTLGLFGFESPADPEFPER
jgi:hypothetical protein